MVSSTGARLLYLIEPVPFYIMLTLQSRMIRCLSAKCNKKSKTIINNAYKLYNNNRTTGAFPSLLFLVCSSVDTKRNPPVYPANFFCSLKIHPCCVESIEQQLRGKKCFLQKSAK